MRGSIFVPKNLIIIEAAKGREAVRDAELHFKLISNYGRCFEKSII